MRASRFVAQLLLLVGLVHINYLIYFNRRIIYKWWNPPSDDRILINSISYGAEFCVAFNVTTNRKTFREDGLEPISLAVHTTSQYINYVLEQVASWDGPISLALFVDRRSQKSIDFLYNMFICDQVFAQKVSLHVVFRLSPFSQDCPSFKMTTIACKNFTYKYMNNFVNQLMAPFVIYPINTMRNVARLGASSHFHLLSDIEMIFSDEFAVSAKKLASEKLCKDCKSVIVVRRFELDSRFKKVPKTVKGLKEHIDNKTAFEYHHKLFPAGHTIAGLWHWFRMSKSLETPKLWEIPYKGPAWEPQLIMHSSAPLSEENVATRFRDQQVLVYEMCRANFKFFLATHLFNVHRGIKEKASSFDNAVHANQQKLKYRFQPWYLKRMNTMYNVSKRCGKFVM